MLKRTIATIAICLCLETGASEQIVVPNYIRQAASEQNLPASAIYAIALKHSGRKMSAETQLIAWPWTIYKGNKRIFLKNQKAIIKYLQAKPSAQFGIYRLSLADMRAFGYVRIEDAVNPIYQTRIVTSVVNTTDLKPALDLAVSYGLIEKRSEQRPTDLSQIIQVASRRHNVPVRVIRAMIQVESAYNRNAISKKGAIGLMQIMPGTARDLGVNPKDLTHPAVNVDTGTRYFAEQLASFKRLDIALAAYNAGPGAVRKYNNRIPPYQETQNYVRKIIGILNQGNIAVNQQLRSTNG